MPKRYNLHTEKQHNTSHHTNVFHLVQFSSSLRIQTQLDIYICVAVMSIYESQGYIIPYMCIVNKASFKSWSQ